MLNHISASQNTNANGQSVSTARIPPSLPFVVAPRDLEFLMPHMTYVRITHASIERICEVSKKMVDEGLALADTSQFTPEKGDNGTNYRVAGPAVQTTDNLLRKGREWGYTYHGKKSGGALNYMLLGFHIWLSRQSCTDKACGSAAHKCERVEELVHDLEPVVVEPEAPAQPSPPLATEPAAPTASALLPPPSVASATSSSRIVDGQDESGHGEPGYDASSPFDDEDDENDEVVSEPPGPVAQAAKAKRYFESLDSSDKTPRLMHERPDGAITVVQGPEDLIRHLAQLVLGRPRVAEPPALDAVRVAEFIVSCGARGTGRMEVIRHFAPWRPGAVPEEQPDFNRYQNSWRHLLKGGKLAHEVTVLGHILTWPKRPVKGGKTTAITTPEGDDRCIAIPKGIHKSTQQVTP